MVKRNSRATRAKTSFGPVSAVSTAPVSIGNSIRGTKARVTNLANGARVVGRDFAFSLKGTASTVTGWELVGGMPLTPAVLPSTILRNYTQMFADFKINKMSVHYVTSSPTSQAGDVLFYYERDALAPMCDYSNASFLPYVLSDCNTIIGPQWANHSLAVLPTKEWKSTGYALHADLCEEKMGSVFLFSKTNATSSPGYILVDYDISFRQLSVNPRSGILPIARGQFTNTSFGASAVSPAAGATITWTIQGNDLSNTAGAAPNGIAIGDVYKVSVCQTASSVINTWTVATAATTVRYNSGTAITLDDGFTCYIYALTTTTFRPYPTFENAMNLTIPLTYQALTAATYTIIANISLVGVSEAGTQSSY